MIVSDVVDKERLDSLEELLDDPVIPNFVPKEQINLDQKTSFLGYAVQRMPVGLAKDLVSSSNGSGNSGNGLTALVGLGGIANTGTVNTGSSNSAGQNSKSNEMGAT